MAYIGKTPVIGNFVKLDAITAVNGQAAYTMQNGGSNFTDYESVNQFLVSLNGTIQAPTDSFTVSGSTLTFASNLSTGDVIDFIMVFGNSLSAGTPTDATVSTAKIVDDAVTAAKINDDIISGATELASEPADTDEFLVSDAGTLKRIDYSLIKGGGITEADQWRITAEKSVSSSGSDITANWERNDTNFAKIGTGMSESSGIFSFASTGVYLIMVNISYKVDGSIGGNDSRYFELKLRATTDDSSYSTLATGLSSLKYISSTTYANFGVSAFFDVTNTSTHKVKFTVESQNATIMSASSSINYNDFSFIRLGDT